MARKRSVAILVLLAVGSSLLACTPDAAPKWLPAVPGAEGKQAFDDLAKLYADKNSVPNYDHALADLKAPDKAARTQAGNYLLALFAQSFADEGNGRAVWQSTPFWGGGAESVARHIRQRIADSFRQNASGASAVPAALWLIQIERVPKNQTAGIEALRRITGPEATAAFLELLSGPTPSEPALVGALEEVGKRQLKELGPQVLALGNSCRAEVRNAARKVARTLGLGPLPEYDAVKAFTPRLEKQLHDIATMIRTRIPADAKWSEVTYIPSQSRFNEAASDEGPKTVSGWVLKQTEDEIFLVDWYADEISVPRAGSRVKGSSLEAAASVFRKLREGKQDKFGGSAAAQLSRQGMLTAQFQSEAISLPEIVVGTAAFERGDRATAAAVLFPRIDAMADDRWLTEIPRDLLGHQYHQEMLDEFTRKRDYAKALDLARHLSQPVFDGYEYRERAMEMAGQIARRGDDFRTLTLPATAEWNQLQLQLPRVEKIRFLANRLRLLNCFQQSQPGDVSYTDPQYSAPIGEDKRVEVINPYNELKRMNLDAADILTLGPYVVDDDFMLTVSYWRDFAPSRTLHRVSWAVAEIINSVAKRDLANPKELQAKSSDERRAQVDKINAWVKANRGKSSTDLRFDTLATANESRDFQRAAAELVADRNVKVLPIFKSRLKDFPISADKIVELAYDLDSAEAAPYAREWVKESSNGVRFWAGLILLRHGDRAKLEGLVEVKDALQGDDGDDLYPYAIEDLLAVKNPAATEMASGILQRGRFEKSFNRSHVLRQLVLDGRQEALDYISKQLDRKEQSGTMFSTIGGKPASREQVVGDDMAKVLSDWRTDGWEYDGMAPDSARAARRKELATWLKGQFARIQKGEASDIAPAKPLIRVQWGIDAP